MSGAVGNANSGEHFSYYIYTFKLLLVNCFHHDCFVTVIFNVSLPAKKSLKVNLHSEFCNGICEE